MGQKNVINSDVFSKFSTVNKFSQIKSMTSCCLIFFLACVHVQCVCVSSLYVRLPTCRQLFVSQSSGQSERHTWADTSAALVWPKPSTASALHPQVFYSVSFHSPSFTSLRPKPHSWPNMAWSHQSDASEYLSETLRYFGDTTAMEAGKKKPILLSWFLERDPGDTEQRDERSQTS